ncbi:MAG TPA: hypothetical protein DDW42_01640 [Desulfobacteraceae bacterium]|nr:hypothetical protein [Desulfobacteraceae bacterium]
MIDRKYKILAINPVSGGIHTEDDAILFLAKDLAVIPMLEAYIEECELLGCEDTHLDGLNILVERVMKYQKDVDAKVPDTNRPGEIERTIKGLIAD